MAYKHLLIKLATPITFILIGAVARILPHAPNFAPIGAMALFGGAYMDKKRALSLPIAAMIISDLVIGFDSLPMRLVVYGSFLMVVLLGMLIKNRINAKTIILSSLSASIVFFIITNFAVWVLGTLYPKTVEGLVQSYFFALPFFRNTLFGDLFYNGLFFGSYNLVLKSSHPWALEQRA